MSIVADTGTWRKPPVAETPQGNPFGQLCADDEQALEFIESELKKFWGIDGQENYCHWLTKRKEELEARKKEGE